MTDNEKFALKAVLYLAANNEKMRENGFYFNRKTKETIKFDDALYAVANMIGDEDNEI